MADYLPVVKGYLPRGVSGQARTGGDQSPPFLAQPAVGALAGQKQGAKREVERGGVELGEQLRWSLEQLKEQQQASQFAYTVSMEAPQSMSYNAANALNKAR